MNFSSARYDAGVRVHTFTTDSSLYLPLLFKYLLNVNYLKCEISNLFSKSIGNLEIESTDDESTTDESSGGWGEFIKMFH